MKEQRRMMAVQAYWIAIHWAGKKAMKPERMLGESPASKAGSRAELRETMQEIEESKGAGELILVGSGDEEVVIPLEEEWDLDGLLSFEDDDGEPEAA